MENYCNVGRNNSNVLSERLSNVAEEISSNNIPV